MPSLPSGTVTFLFTDIEGSTKLWEDHPEAMRSALARHDALLRETIGAHHGIVFKAGGDSFFAVFATAPNALTAACAAQQALLREVWDVPGGLRVRMALHTGTAEQRDGDYFGATLNRIARLLSTGHGGQILVSEATRTLGDHDAAVGVSFRDCGYHRLKDLARPEHIFQVITPDLPADFPPLKTLDTLPNNLPRQLTNFIGREREMADVKRLLGTHSLLTLTGSGGCGKTRLSLQVAADLAETFADGAWFVELAPLSAPTLVPQAVASALGVREELGRASLVDTLADFLQAKVVLLLLDNCEHVLSAAAELAYALLRRCPHVRILATSQQALGAEGEVTYPVPSLSVPDPLRLPPLEELATSEAVRLFVERAILAQPHFTLTETNASQVALICHRLDGIPLAIELAAARIRTMPVVQIAARLDDRFRLLGAGSRTAPERHQTLRAALDWSYELLSSQEQALLRRLAVFAGGFTLEAAEVVCAAAGEVEPRDVIDLVTQLVDKSLVIFDELDGHARYRLLETVRLYSWDRLRESGEEETTERRHRDWFVQLAEQAEPQLQSPDQVTWLNLLEADHDNLRAALEWSKREEDGADAELRLAGALWHYWEVRGYWIEGVRWLEDALGRSSGLQAVDRVKALNAAAYLAIHQADFPRARPLVEESLALSRQLGDKQGAASCLNIMGLQACRLENYSRAAELGQESLVLSREVGDKWGTAYALVVLGLVARGQADYGRARTLLEDGLTRFRELGEKWGSAVTLNNLGLVAVDQRDDVRAKALFEETLTLSRELGHKWNSAFALSNLAIVAWRQHDYPRAAALFKESLRIRNELREKQGIATCLVGLAGVASAQGALQRAGLLFGAAAALREAVGLPLPPFMRDSYEAHVAEAKAGLGEAAFAATWGQGRTMAFEEVIEYALRDDT